MSWEEATLSIRLVGSGYHQGLISAAVVAENHCILLLCYTLVAIVQPLTRCESLFSSIEAWQAGARIMKLNCPLMLQ